MPRMEKALALRHVNQTDIFAANAGDFGPDDDLRIVLKDIDLRLPKFATCQLRAATRKLFSEPPQVGSDFEKPLFGFSSPQCLDDSRLGRPLARGRGSRIEGKLSMASGRRLPGRRTFFLSRCSSRLRRDEFRPTTNGSRSSVLDVRRQIRQTSLAAPCPNRARDHGRFHQTALPAQRRRRRWVRETGRCPPSLVEAGVGSAGDPAEEQDAKRREAVGATRCA